MKIALLLVVAAVFISGCGDEESSQPGADAVVATVERFHPDATDITCASSSDSRYTCAAVVNGRDVTYRATASSAGVYLTSSPSPGQ